MEGNYVSVSLHSKHPAAAFSVHEDTGQLSTQPLTQHSSSVVSQPLAHRHHTYRQKKAKQKDISLSSQAEPLRGSRLQNLQRPQRATQAAKKRLETVPETFVDTNLAQGESANVIESRSAPAHQVNNESRTKTDTMTGKDKGKEKEPLKDTAGNQGAGCKPAPDAGDRRLPAADTSDRPFHLIPGLRTSLHFQTERHMPGLEDPEGKSESNSPVKPESHDGDLGSSRRPQPLDEQMADIDARIDAANTETRTDSRSVLGTSAQTPPEPIRVIRPLHYRQRVSMPGLPREHSEVDDGDTDSSGSEEHWRPIPGRRWDRYRNRSLSSLLEQEQEELAARRPLQPTVAQPMPIRQPPIRGRPLEYDEGKEGFVLPPEMRHRPMLLPRPSAWAPPRPSTSGAPTPSTSAALTPSTSVATNSTGIGPELARALIECDPDDIIPIARAWDAAAKSRNARTEHLNDPTKKKSKPRSSKASCRPQGFQYKTSEDDGDSEGEGAPGPSSTSLHSRFGGRSGEPGSSTGVSGPAASRHGAYPRFTQRPVSNAPASAGHMNAGMSAVAAVPYLTHVAPNITAPAGNIPPVVGVATSGVSPGQFLSSQTAVARGGTTHPTIALGGSAVYPRQSTYWAGPRLNNYHSSVAAQPGNGTGQPNAPYQPDPIGTPRQNGLSGSSCYAGLPSVPRHLQQPSGFLRFQLSATAPEFTSRMPAGAGSNGMMQRESQSGAYAAGPPSYRPLLEKGVSCNWSEINAKIVTSNDQQASIFMQQKLKSAPAEQKYEIVQACIECAIQLMVNRFGNFLIQRCFEHATPEQIGEFAKKILGHVESLAVDPFGCHVVQKAFDSVPESYKILMVYELLGSVRHTIVHRYGCHVWQKMLELRWVGDRPPIMSHVNQSLKGMWIDVALGETSSLVVQNIFENCLDAEKRDCIEEVLRNIDEVACGQFGNWCIQHVCEHGSEADKVRAIEHVLRNAVNYSTDQYASKVVEKCLKTGGPTFLKKYLERLCERIQNRPRVALIDVASDQYGNYLIQLILTSCDAPVREQISAHIRRHLVSMRGSKHGSRVANMCCAPPLAPRRAPGGGRVVGSTASSCIATSFR